MTGNNWKKNYERIAGMITIKVENTCESQLFTTVLFSTSCHKFSIVLGPESLSSGRRKSAIVMDFVAKGARGLLLHKGVDVNRLDLAYSWFSL